MALQRAMLDTYTLTAVILQLPMVIRKGDD